MNFADLASMNLIDRFNNRRPTASLGTHLDNTVVFASGFNGQFAFFSRLAARFFYIHMLACGTSEYRRRGVPMIGCRNHQCIDRLVVQDTANVRGNRGGTRLRLSNHFSGSLCRSRIDITDRNDFSVRCRKKTFGQRQSATVHPHHRNAYRLIGRSSLLGIQRGLATGLRDRCSGKQRRAGF